MALQSLPGGSVLIGPRTWQSPDAGISAQSLNAVNKAVIYVGRMRTSDGGSHTINTSGSSAMNWLTGSIVFANGATVVNVGLATPDTSNGPAGRAVNVAGLITFDVSAPFTGGGGGITDSAWQTHVPTTGTKTIANGDLVAFAVQMISRGGTDAIPVAYSTPIATVNRPTVDYYNGSTFARQGGTPNCFITFSDGAFGWIDESDLGTAFTVRTWNSGSATKEYGQLYQMPFPMRVYGIYGLVGFVGDADLILYTDPLGTPVASKTVSIDANTVGGTLAAWFSEMFASPLDVAANQPVGVVIKPTTGSNVTTYFKTVGNAQNRIADPWGTSGYGISRASGAFANANSSKDQYYVGLTVSAFDGGGGGTAGAGFSASFVG